MSSKIALLCLAVAGCSSVNGTLEHAPPPLGAYTAQVPVEVSYVDLAVLSSLCELSPTRLVGCSLLYRNRCQIYVARELTPSLRKEVLAHEEAHCGGWTHDD